MKWPRSYFLVLLVGFLSACTTSPKDPRCANEIRLIEPEGIDSLPRFQLKDGREALLNFLDSMTKEANEDNHWQVYFLLEESVALRCSFDPLSLMPTPPVVCGFRSRMDIMVNHANQLLIEGDLSHSSDVSSRWKRMLLNEGIDPNLATSPKNAAIRILMDSLISTDTLAQILNQIHFAQYDVRTKFAERIFNRPLCQIPRDSFDLVFDRYPLRLFIETSGMRNYSEVPEDPIFPPLLPDSLDEPNEPK